MLRVAWVLLLVFPLFGALSVPACAAADDGWYKPVEADFRPAYDADARNREKQSWNDYWGWVRQFYAGNFFSKGWTAECRSALGSVKSGDTRKALQKRINDLGLLVSREWAKDNSVRKIDTADVGRWSSSLKKAKDKDNGDGEEISRAVRTAKEEAEQHLR